MVFASHVYNAQAPRTATKKESCQVPSLPTLIVVAPGTQEVSPEVIQPTGRPGPLGTLNLEWSRVIKINCWFSEFKAQGYKGPGADPLWMNSQWHLGSPGAWTHHSGELVVLQPKQICSSGTGIQDCQSSICVRQMRPLSGQRGLLGLILLWLLYSQ